MSVDTYLKGKNTSGYRRVHHEDVVVLLSPQLLKFANKVELVTKRKVVGKKLIALAHHEHTNACRH